MIRRKREGTLSGEGLALSNLSWLGLSLISLTFWHSAITPERITDWLILVSSTGGVQLAPSSSQTSRSTH